MKTLSDFQKEVDRADPSDVCDWAARWLYGLHLKEQRELRLRVEREAAQEVQQRRQTAAREAEEKHERYLLGTEKDEAYVREMNRQVDGWVEREEERSRKFRAKMEEIHQVYRADLKEELRMEWTEELLSTEFGLRDGSRTTWGEATVAQFEERREMFAVQAQSGHEGMARVEQALDALRSTGATCLSEVVS